MPSTAPRSAQGRNHAAHAHPPPLACYHWRPSYAEHEQCLHRVLPPNARLRHGAPEWTAILLAEGTHTPPVASLRNNGAGAGAGVAKGKEKERARFELCLLNSPGCHCPHLSHYKSAYPSVSTSVLSASSLLRITYSPTPSTLHKVLLSPLYIYLFTSTPTTSWFTLLPNSHKLSAARRFWDSAPSVACPRHHSGSSTTPPPRGEQWGSWQMRAQPSSRRLRIWHRGCACATRLAARAQLTSLSTPLYAPPRPRAAKKTRRREVSSLVDGKGSWSGCKG